MSILAFRKALHQLPLSQEERDALTTDELFVLLLTRRLDRLTKAEQEKLKPTDLQYLVQARLIRTETAVAEAADSAATGLAPHTAAKSG